MLTEGDRQQSKATPAAQRQRAHGLVHDDPAQLGEGLGAQLRTRLGQGRLRHALGERLLADDLEEAVQLVLVSPFAQIQQEPHQLRQRQFAFARKRPLADSVALGELRR